MIRLWILAAISVSLVQCAELPPLDTQTIDCPVSAAKPDGTKLKLKYLTTEAFVKTEDKSKAPILMHLTFGDSVEKVLKGEEFVYDLASQMGAVLAVVEHRIFGSSQIPDDPSPTTAAKLDEYMKPEDILNDFIIVGEKLKENRDGILVVSGSAHAAVLATLLRKLDKTIDGAIISNGALNLFTGGLSNLAEFDSFLISVYKAEGCPMDRLNAAFDALMKADINKASDRTEIHNGLELSGTEKGLQDAFGPLITYIHRGFEDLVLQNFDVPHSTMDGRSFDSRPVKKVCDDIAAATIGNSLSEKLKPILLILKTSYKTKLQNYLIPSWPRKNERDEFTRCSYFAPYHCPIGGNNDYFGRSLYACGTEDNKPPVYDNWLSATQTFCEAIITGDTADIISKNADFVKKQTNFNFDDISKIIFIDGAEDPNSVGAVKTVKAENQQYKFTIPKTTRAAHLLQPSSCDSTTMKQLRYRVARIVQCWSGVLTDEKDCSQSILQGGDLPSYVSNVSGDCQPALLAYPWGQGGDPEEPGEPGGNPTGRTRATTVSSSAHSIAQSFALILIAFFMTMTS